MFAILDFKSYADLLQVIYCEETLRDCHVPDHREIFLRSFFKSFELWNTMISYAFHCFANGRLKGDSLDSPGKNFADLD